MAFVDAASATAMYFLLWAFYVSSGFFCLVAVIATWHMCAGKVAEIIDAESYAEEEQR